MLSSFIDEEGSRACPNEKASSDGERVWLARKDKCFPHLHSNQAMRCGNAARKNIWHETPNLRPTIKNSIAANLTSLHITLSLDLDSYMQIVWRSDNEYF